MDGAPRVQAALLVLGDRTAGESRRPVRRGGCAAGRARRPARRASRRRSRPSRWPAARPRPGTRRDATRRAKAGLTSRRLWWRALCHGSGKNVHSSVMLAGGEDGGQRLGAVGDDHPDVADAVACQPAQGGGDRGSEDLERHQVRLRVRQRASAATACPVPEPISTIRGASRPNTVGPVDAGPTVPPTCGAPRWATERPRLVVAVPGALLGLVHPSAASDVGHHVAVDPFGDGHGGQSRDAGRGGVRGARVAAAGDSPRRTVTWRGVDQGEACARC